MIFTVSAWVGHHGTAVIEAEPYYPTGRTMYGIGTLLWVEPGAGRPIPSWAGRAIGLNRNDIPVRRPWS